MTKLDIEREIREITQVKAPLLPWRLREFYVLCPISADPV
jgi:hypothetical protein